MLSWHYQLCADPVEKGSNLRLRHIELIISRTSQHQHMSEGTIARLTDKGFGFISREGEEKDLFFHSNELVDVSFDELREGDKVTFEVADSPKGPNAVKVSRV